MHPFQLDHTYEALPSCQRFLESSRPPDPARTAETLSPSTASRDTPESRPSGAVLIPTPAICSLVREPPRRRPSPNSQTSNRTTNPAAVKQPSSARPRTGADRDRTDNLCLAKAALSQLSYGPAAERPGHARPPPDPQQPPPPRRMLQSTPKAITTTSPSARTRGDRPGSRNMW